jgi:5-methylcytosine-specific restriction protein B
MTELNAEITSDAVRLGAGYQIGHSFFVPMDNTQVLDSAWYKRVIHSEICPLLREYWFDDPEKADRWQAKLLDGIV